MKHFFTLRLPAVLAVMTIVGFGFSMTASAQKKYIITPSNTINNKWNGKESIHPEVYIENRTPDPLQLSWAILENTIPMTWDYNICDNLYCYDPVNSGLPMGEKQFYLIVKGESAFFKLEFKSSVTDVEKATIQLAVWETGKMQDGVDTVSFNILPETNGVPETTTPFAAVLPNPTNDLVHLTAFNAIQTVEVFTAVGVKVMEVANSSAEVSLDVRSLPVGVYFVKARDIYGKINTATFHKF